MALNKAIHRAASRVVPLFFSRRYMNHHRSALLGIVNNPSRNILERPFSSLVHHPSSKPTSYESLLRDIVSDIQCAAVSKDADEEVPKDIPFEIEYHPIPPYLTLTRECEGETITGEVLTPTLVTFEEKNFGYPTPVPLVLRITKESGLCFEFSCTAYPLAIVRLAIKDPEHQIADEGPDFRDLDANLQQALHKYLEIRGITPSTMDFLFDYMAEKKYMAFLERMIRYRDIYMWRTPTSGEGEIHV